MTTSRLGPWVRAHEGDGLARYWHGQSQIWMGMRLILDNDEAHVTAWNEFGKQRVPTTMPIVGLTRAEVFRRAHDAHFHRVPHCDVDTSPQAKALQDCMRHGVLDQQARFSLPSTLSSSATAVPTENRSQGAPMSDPTIAMITDNLAFGGKIVLSHQAMRLLRTIAYKIVKSRLGEGADAFLQTREGAIMIDLAMPSAFHVLASRNMIPLAVQQNQRIAAICDYAFKGALIRHGLDLTDMAAELVTEITGDLTELASLGTMLIAEAPDFEKEAEELARTGEKIRMS